MSSRGLKLLGAEKSVDEVDAEPDGHGEADERFRHWSRSSQPVAERGVKAHQPENSKPKGEKNQIEHDSESPVSGQEGIIGTPASNRDVEVGPQM
ncbi:MAG: hypothetical protein ACREC6_03685 [Hyphomicrobiaceae bacterium]